jgi:hypothetical protein
MTLEEMSVDKMTVEQTSCYHASAMVLPGERGIWEGENQEREKRENSKTAFYCFFVRWKN